jgi:hypothetical protein
MINNEPIRNEIEIVGIIRKSLGESINKTCPAAKAIPKLAYNTATIENITKYTKNDLILDFILTPLTKDKKTRITVCPIRTLPHVIITTKIGKFGESQKNVNITGANKDV